MRDESLFIADQNRRRDDDDFSHAYLRALIETCNAVPDWTVDEERAYSAR